MRRWGEGQIRRITITDGKHSLTLAARCVWLRQDGLFSHSIGLAFEPASAAEERALAEMASDHSLALTPIPPHEQTPGPPEPPSPAGAEGTG